MEQKSINFNFTIHDYTDALKYKDYYMAGYRRGLIKLERGEWVIWWIHLSSIEFYQIVKLHNMTVQEIESFRRGFKFATKEAKKWKAKR